MSKEKQKLKSIIEKVLSKTDLEEVFFEGDYLIDDLHNVVLEKLPKEIKVLSDKLVNVFPSSSIGYVKNVFAINLNYCENHYTLFLSFEYELSEYVENITSPMIEELYSAEDKAKEIEKLKKIVTQEDIENMLLVNYRFNY